MSTPAIGKLQTVAGLVTITRANVVVAQPAVGDLVYEGDLIETGIDGLIAIGSWMERHFIFTPARTWCWTNSFAARKNLLIQRCFVS